MVAKPTEGTRAAEEIVARPRGALREPRVELPSLRVDPVTAACDEPYPLVELGRCNLDTAVRLEAAPHGARR